MSAQNNSPSNNLPSFSVTSSGPHHRVWSSVTAQTNLDGQVTYKTAAYTELATGMNFKVGEQWVPAFETIQITQAGGMATNGQHQVHFTANLNTTGAIDLTTPDGQHLQSHVMGLGYLDTGSGTSVLFAPLQDSTGQVLPTLNQVLYTNAFSNLNADVRYTYTKAGFEQDIILRQQPPSPSQWNLIASNTVLQVWTEFTAAPQPQVNTFTNAKTKLTDDDLEFGTMHLGRGKAFAIGDNKISAHVNKHWQTVEGRTFLIEEIPLLSIAAQLNSLPPTSMVPGSRNIPAAKQARLLPPPAARESAPLRLASTVPPSSGFVLDYITLNSTLTNYTFQGDSTYYISGTVAVYGNTTFEGGAVIKYTNDASATIIGGNPGLAYTTNWFCPTDPYHPVIFCSKDDNTVGAAIGGSTGSPSSYCGGTALDIERTAYPLIPVFKNMRFSNLEYALNLEDGFYKLYNCQFVNCNNGIYLDTVSFYLGNALFDRVINVFYCVPEPVNATLENVTVRDAVRFCTLEGFEDDPWDNGGVDDKDFSVTINNALFSGIGEIGLDFLAASDSYVTTNGSYFLGTYQFFQTNGAGANYLSTYGRGYVSGVGTTSIDATLLGELSQMTTYPPVAWTNLTVTANLTLSPTVIRDTSSNPDPGYHYPVIDYAFGGVTLTNAAMTVQPGTVIALFATNGLDTGLTIGIAGQLLCTGSPTSLARFINYNTVQEQPTTNWITPTHAMLLPYTGTNTPASLLSFRFTDFAVMAQDTAFLSDTNGLCRIINFQDCQFHGGSLFSTNVTINLTNCLLERVNTTIQANDTNAPQIRNNLFYYGNLDIQFANTNALIQNNLFDGNTNNDHGLTSYYGNYNAYVTGFTHLTLTNSHDKFVSTSRVYQAGPLGNYYYPTNGTDLATLINAGSTSADNLGLYHYTTQTNEVKETNSTVDIGYHYVALNSSNLPPDANTNGIADYLEDGDGNGVFNVGDIGDWQRNGYSVTSNLVVYWRLNDTNGSMAADSSGNGYAATLTNSPAWGSNYLTLNGTSQYGYVNTNTATDFDHQNLTFCAWIKQASRSIHETGIVDKTHFDSTNHGTGWGLWVTADGHLEFLGASHTADTSSNVVAVGEWTFVTVVWNESIQRADFYINGILIDPQPDPSNHVIENPYEIPLLLGNLLTNLDNGAYTFNGLLRDVAIYNRALTSNEVELNFLSTKDALVNLPDLLYYSMTDFDTAGTNNYPFYLLESSGHGSTTGKYGPSQISETWLPNNTGVSNSALHFSGGGGTAGSASGTFVETGSATLLNFTNNSFTINLWVDEYTTNGYIAGNSSSGVGGWYLIYYANHLYFGSEPSGNSLYYAETPHGWPQSAMDPHLYYHMITITRQGSDQPVFYIDGLMVPVSNSFDSPGSTANTVKLGRGTNPSDYDLDGNIWLFQAWSSALSGANVAELYHNQSRGFSYP